MCVGVRVRTSEQVEGEVEAIGASDAGLQLGLWVSEFVRCLRQDQGVQFRAPVWGVRERL